MILILSFLSSIYGLYLFRKTLRHFQKGQAFNLYVINTFHKIGWIFTIAAILSSTMLFLLRLTLESTFSINFGITPYLVLMCLGLFFMALSETFRVARIQKQENDLTI